MNINPQTLIDEGYIPLDKSWILRMGILDIVHGSKRTLFFLEQEENLGDDLLALKRVAEKWNTIEPLDVGESGTLYRFLTFTAWKFGKHKKFITRGTLHNRKITNDPSIVNLPLAELLKLDNGTSQWASAALLLGSEEKVLNPPHKLQVTYDAIEHWKERKKEGKEWQPKYDATILHQAVAFISINQEQKPDWKPTQAEDYCFAYAFGYITAEEGEKRWPSLRGHESDRIDEMTKQLKHAQNGRPVSSKDHRVVQAIAMWATVQDKRINILHPEAVNKSWPQFWDFIEYIGKGLN